MFPEKIRALLIEDNPGDARLVREMLCGARNKQFELDWTDRLAAGLQRLEQGGIDGVLLDLSLPDCRGLETIARVHAQAPEIPIVVLTGLGDESVMFEAVQNGAQDYLQKGRLDSESLTRAMRYAIQRKRSEQEIRLRALQSATVAALGEEALSNPRLEDFMRKAAVLVAGNLKVKFCQVLESSPEQGGAPLAVASASADPAAGHDAVSWEALADCAIRAASPIIVEDFSTEKRFAVSPAIRERGITSGACVPVLGRERPFGALGVFTSARRTFTTEDVSFLQSVANVLAAAIERKCYEDEMVQSRDLALETSRLKSAFLANMSHEIRTPLSGVIGMTELLLDSGLNPEQTECAETIRSSADTLLTVVNDILEFSRISADKVVLDCKPFEQARIVKEVTTLVSVEARRKGLKLTQVVAPEVPVTVYGDPVRLRQVLSNLVGNAVKFTDRGSVSVDVRMETESENAVLLRFEIRDSGIGIPRHLMGRLFQPFSQVERFNRPPLWRDRPGARNLSQAGRADERRDRGRERAGPGLELPFHRPLRQVSFQRAIGTAFRCRCARAGRAVSAHADPAGRGRSHQPESRDAPTAKARLCAPSRLQRKRSAGRTGADVLSGGADGLRDARHGRVPNHRRDSPPRKWQRPPYDRARAHGPRDGRRAQQMPERRDGRLYHQADTGRGIGGGAGKLSESEGNRLDLRNRYLIRSVTACVRGGV